MRLIDADVLMELYADSKDFSIAMCNVPIPVVRQNILDMPTIEAEPVKHGRWKKMERKKVYSGFDSDWDLVSWSDYPIICTRCQYDLTEHDEKPNKYCPNCGAKMDLGEQADG